MSDLEVKAQNASAVIPATELHGMVCGFAAADPLQFSLSDFVQLAGADALSDEESVSEFVRSSLDELFSEEMGFQPLIPDDSELLSTRLMGLAEWCAGFLSGFGASHRSVFARFPHPPAASAVPLTRDQSANASSNQL